MASTTQRPPAAYAPEGLGRGTTFKLTPVQVAALIASGVCLIVFVATTLRGVGYGDSAEFQRISFELGITHPPGYPLQVLTGKLFSFLPVGSVAFRVNLMSAVSAAAAAGVCVLVMGRLGIRPIVAAACGTAAALSAIVWAEATIAAANALQALLVVLAIHRALVWRDEGRTRDLFLVSVFMGLAALAHLIAVPMAALVGLYTLWVGRERIRARFRVLVVATAGLLVGLSPVLYMPIRGATGPSDNYRSVATLDGFLGWVTGAQYRAVMTSTFSVEGATRLITELPAWLGFLAASTGALVVALSAIGIVLLLYARPALGLLFVTLFGLGVYFYLNYVPVLDRYLIVSVMLIGVCAAVAVDRLVVSAGRWAPWAAILSVLLPLGVASMNLAAMDRSGRPHAESFVERVFQQLPPSAAILSYWDALHPMAYQHCVEGWRPDIVIASPRDVTFQDCDPQQPLREMVGSRPVYALFYRQADLDWLAQDFQLTTVLSLHVPWSGRMSDQPVPLVRVEPRS